MGIVKRKYGAERMKLHKDFKRPIMLVSKTMPIGFTDDDFCNQFEKLEPLCWRRLEDKYDSYRSLDEIRKKKGRHLRNFPTPKHFLLDEGRSAINTQRHLYQQGLVNEEERISLIADMERKAQAKKEKIQKQIKEDLTFIQELCPKYMSKMVKLYYYLRKKNTLDVNQRLYMILEASKYRSPETIAFLKRIQQGDKNENLRLVAYKALSSMHAPDVTLHRKRKGKKKISQTKSPEKILTPVQLLKSIEVTEFERLKQFDIFMSHSSDNQKLIQTLMKELNQNGQVCYIDWVEDRNELRREYSSAETAEVIVKRIQQSKVFLYVLTEEGVASTWCAWELGVAYAIGKPIAILQLEETKHHPEYLDMYPHFSTEQISTDLIQWIKNI